MKYDNHFINPIVGELFERKGTNPFNMPIVYELKEIRRDNINNKWYHLESEHEHLYIPDSDLFLGFVKIEK